MVQIRGKKKIKSYFAPRTTPGAQPFIRSALATKVMIDNAKMNVARWWYRSNVPFYASRSPYYQLMIDFIVAIGPGFKEPSFCELRGPLLKNAVHEINDFFLDIKNVWKEYGRSVMSDGWTNQKQQPIMNFLVYCPRGAMFLKSIDTSGLTKDAKTLFNIFDSVVQEIGEFPFSLGGYLFVPIAAMLLPIKKLEKNYSKSMVLYFGLLVQLIA